MPIAGRAMLSYQLERLKRVKLARHIVVATTRADIDDAIVDFCASEGVDCTRGSENDVLSRYAEAAQKFDAEIVVRVTSDCPLIDPEVVDLAIRTFLDATSRFDYVSNMMEPTWPYGMAVEVLAANALYSANDEATDVAEREHVTPFIYWRPKRYKLKSVTMAPNLCHHRWTVDTPEDFELVSRILLALYPSNPEFCIADVLALLEQHPSWEHINQHVLQKSARPANCKEI